MKKTILTIIIVIAMATVTWAADVTPNLNKGTKQINIYGSYDNNHPLDYQLVLGGGFGYFFFDNFEVAASGAWSSNDLSDAFELGLAAEYNFYFGSPFVPFLQVGAFWTGIEVNDDVYNKSSEIDTDAWLGRFGGGVKYFFRDDIALGASVVCDIATDDIWVDEDGNVDDYNWKALLGLSFYFD